MALRPPPPAQPSRQPSKRAAPPSLFVGPPTPEVPSTELPQSASPLSSSPLNTASTGPQTAALTPPDLFESSQKGLYERQRQPSTTAQSWRALQSTFEDVELNALSGASVFGAEHSRALEELRKAQVELARAWARGEGDGDGETVFDDGSRDVFGDGFRIDETGGDAGKSGAGISSSGPKSAVLAGQKDGEVPRDRGGSVGSASGRDEGTKQRPAANASGKTDLERETENDILLARKRRMANDRYFERVNKGVVDVVAKLEVVAQKMGSVEMESQEIWGVDSDSTDSDGG